MLRDVINARCPLEIALIERFRLDVIVTAGVCRVCIRGRVSLDQGNHIRVDLAGGDLTTRERCVVHRAGRAASRVRVALTGCRRCREIAGEFA